MDKVTGHMTAASIGTAIYDHPTLSEVQEAVEAIRNPGLKLPTAGLKTELRNGPIWGEAASSLRSRSPFKAFL